MKLFYNVEIELSKNSPFIDWFSYPAGEQQVRLKADKIPELQEAYTISIVARIKSGDDLIALALLKDCLDHSLVEPRLHLVLPYLPYGRADRRFTDFDCHGLSFFGDFINSLGFLRVETLDVHSREARNYIDSLYNCEPRVWIQKSIDDFSGEAGHPINILYPDQGAALRHQNDYRNVHKALYCEKERDPETGKLLGFKIPAAEEFEGRDTLIIDDICDGGGTFIGIAKELFKHTEDPLLALYVSHGIFSKGFEELNKCFLKIYTTDSILQAPAPRLTVFTLS